MKEWSVDIISIGNRGRRIESPPGERVRPKELDSDCDSEEMLELT